MKLYEISAQYSQAFSDLSEMLDAGDIDQGILDASLAGLQGELEDKCISVAFHIKNQEGELEAVKKEIERLAKRKKQLEAGNEWLKGYLLRNMKSAGMDRLNHPVMPITINKPRQVVEVTDPCALPAKYIISETVVKPDKRLLAADLKLGQVSGAELVDGNPGLKIG